MLTAISQQIRAPLHTPISYRVRQMKHAGDSRHCPVCSSDLKTFLPYGVKARDGALCGVCGALERHRLMWLYLTQRTDLLDGRPKKMLHMAPERPLARQLARQKNLDYISGDLDPTKAMVVMDITSLDCADETFDVIYCSHVLEHVPEDRAALKELYRVLRPGGWAILQVPIKGEVTQEDPTVTSPEERTRLYGQADHVRQYGSDYKDRLVEAGFNVSVEPFVETLPEAEIVRMGLSRHERIHFCTR